MKQEKLLIAIVLLLVLIRVGSASWPYRRSITIDNTQNSNDLYNYQIAVNLTYNSNMQSDFDDIRFRDLNDNLLSYWIEEKVDSQWVYVWVKVPYIPALSTTTIYVYYGNPSAASASNGKTTFIHFDDFDDGSFNNTMWYSFYGSWTEASGYVSFSSSSSYSYITPYQPLINQRNYAVIDKVRVTASSTYGDYRINIRINPYTDKANSTAFMTRIGNTNSANCDVLFVEDVIGGTNSSSPSANCYPINTWIRRELRAYENYFEAYVNNQFKISLTASEGNLNGLPATMYGHTNGVPYQVDYLFTRNFSLPEPAYNVGSEENVGLLLINPSSPVTYPTQTNATCSGDTFLRNGTDISSENGIFVTLPAGVWNYTCINGTNVESQLYTVNKASTSLSLSFDPSSPINYGTQMKATCTENSQGNALFLINGTAYAYNDTFVILPAGNYNFTCYVPETQNYTAASSSSMYTINKKSTSLSLSFNPSSPIIYETQMKATCVEDSEANALFTRNGTAYAYNDTFVILPAGAHNFSCSVLESQNYTEASSSSIYLVNKKSLGVSLITNNTSSGQYYYLKYPNGIYVEALADSNLNNLVGFIYRNGSSVSNPYYAQLSYGWWNFTAVSQSNENYTSTSQQRLVYSGQPPEAKIWYPNSTIYLYPWSSKNIPVAANATTKGFNLSCSLSIDKGTNQTYPCDNYKPLRVENGWLNVTYSDANGNTYDKNLNTNAQYFASISGTYLQHWFRLPNNTANAEFPYWNYTINVSTRLYAYQYGITINFDVWNYDTSSWDWFWPTLCPTGQVCDLHTLKSLSNSHVRDNQVRLRSWWGSQNYYFYLHEVYIPNTWFNVFTDYYYNVQTAGNHSFDFYTIENNTSNEAYDSTVQMIEFVSIYNVTNNKGQNIQNVNVKIQNSTDTFEITANSPIYLNNTLLPKGNVTVTLEAPNYMPLTFNEYITDSYHVYKNITLINAQLKIKVLNEQSLSPLPWYKLYITNATGTGQGSYTNILTVGKGYPSTPFSNLIDGDENTYITSPVNITYNFGYTNATFKLVYDSTSAGSVTIRIWNTRVGVFDTVKTLSVGGAVGKTTDFFQVDNSPKIPGFTGGDYQDLFYNCNGYYCPLFEIVPSGGMRLYEMKLVAPYTYDENGFVSANYSDFGMSTGISSLIFRSPLTGSASNLWGQRQYFISPQSYQETELYAFLNPFCYSQGFRVLEYNPQNPTQPIPGAMLSIYKEFQGNTYVIDQYQSDSQGNARLCVESGYPYTFVAQKSGYETLVSYDNTFAFTETINVYLTKQMIKYFDYYIPARNITCGYNGQESECFGNIIAPNVTVKCSILSQYGNILNTTLLVIKDSRNWDYPPIVNNSYPPSYDNQTLPFNLNSTNYQVLFNTTSNNPYGSTLQYTIPDSGYYTYYCTGYFYIINASNPALEGQIKSIGSMPGSFSLNANVMAPSGVLLSNYITPGGIYLFMLLVNLGITGFFVSRFGVSSSVIFLLVWGLTLTVLGGWGFNFQTGLFVLGVLLALAVALSFWRR